MQPICKFPGCTQRAGDHFAALSLCTDHKTAVWDETSIFYDKGMKGLLNAPERSYRTLYSQIDSQIAHSKKRMGKLG